MDIQFNFIVSNNIPNNVSPAQQILLRLLSLGEGGDSSHHSPIVSKINECKNRCEAFNKDLLSFIKKTKDGLNEIANNIDSIADDDPNIQLLVDDIVKSHSGISSALLNIEPMVKSQLESITKLSDHVRPPTEELFRTKALNIISKNSVQKVPQNKKNTCTICLENTADVLINRNCTNKKNKDSSSNVNNQSSTPTQNASTSTVSNSTNNTNNSNNSNNSNNASHSTQPNTTTTTTTTSATGRRIRTLGMLFPGFTSAERETETQRKTTFCENALCKCGPIACKECLIKHYWVSTVGGFKSFSTCVCCRAEFCLKDIHNVEYEEEDDEEEEIQATIISDDNSSTTNATNSSSKKRKESTNETSSNKRLRSKDNEANKKSKDKKKSESNDTTTLKRSKEYKKKSIKSLTNRDLNPRTIVLDSDTDSDTSDEKDNINIHNHNNNDNDDDEDDEGPSNENRGNRVSPFNTFKKLINFWK